jgi:hypothetical protein
MISHRVTLLTKKCNHWRSFEEKLQSIFLLLSLIVLSSNLLLRKYTEPCRVVGALAVEASYPSIQRSSPLLVLHVLSTECMLLQWMKEEKAH